MTERRRYRNFVWDSARWDGFTFRDGDIVISTPPKSGTTWTQMLCALLVFRTTELPRPLAQISPWLDMQMGDLGTVLASLDAMAHRRVIKTHTPLDGVPWDERATYVCVGRDPRDVAISWDHHVSNIDFDRFLGARAGGVGLDDMAELLADAGAMPEPSDDPVERFWAWVDAEPSPMMGVTLSSVLGHIETFWQRRGEPNVVLLHYGDLQRDLLGQARRLAGALGIDVDDAELASLTAAASFDSMRSNADVVVPNSTEAFWVSNESFFHRGSNDQWRELLGDADLSRYDERVAELVSPDVARWAHHGWLGIEAVAPASV